MVDHECVYKALSYLDQRIFRHNYLPLRNVGYTLVGTKNQLLSTHPMSQKLKGTPRLLFGNG